MKHQSQQGVVLVMALLYLSILTLLVIAALEFSLLQTKMAAHTADSTNALQAAESALTTGENAVQITQDQGSGANYQYKRRPETDCGVVYYQIDATGKYSQALAQLEAILLVPEPHPPNCQQAIPSRHQVAWQQLD